MSRVDRHFSGTSTLPGDGTGEWWGKGVNSIVATLFCNHLAVWGTYDQPSGYLPAADPRDGWEAKL